MKRFLTTFFALTLFSTVGVLGEDLNKAKQNQLGNILTINGVPLNNMNWEVENNNTPVKPNKPNCEYPQCNKPNFEQAQCNKPNCEPTTEGTTNITNKPEKPNNTIATKPTTENVHNQNSNSQVSEIEKEVVRLVNLERQKAGLKPLQIDEKLSSVARLKSEDMKNKNYFNHTSPTYGTPFDMMQQFNIKYKRAGENIAKGQKTAKEVVDAWMNSEGHRRNILSKSFTHIGVGYTKRGNTPYWTQMFIAK